MTEPVKGAGDAAGGREPDEVADPWSAATDDDAEQAEAVPAEAVPAEAGPVAGAVSDGLPEHWPGRETIREPPHPGLREVLPPPRAPRPPAPRSRRPEPPGTDLLTGAQRWLIRSSARNVRREIEDSVRRKVRSARAEPEDIWGVATTEPPPDLTEAPECAWCPICRAARRMRDSGGGLSSVSEAVASAVQDAFGALDGVLSRTTAATGHERPAGPGSRYPHSAGGHEHAESASDEPGDRG